MPSNHSIGGDDYHFGWDNSLEPVLTVAPGEVVQFDAMDAGGGQITPHSSLADVSAIDFGRVNPAYGPVFVDGAVPGDALKITILSTATQGWGWTANIPGFGVLADRFTEPALHIWKFDAEAKEPAIFGPGGCVPLNPFPGILGLAPAQSGVQSVVNPRRVGGNMDTRDLTEGTELLLPVEVPGALFSCGDGHAAQGDGEVCGTAIEAPLKVAVKLDLVKGANISFPQFTTPGPVSRHFDGKGYLVTTGVGPDLMESARNAVGDMVDLIASRYGMEEVEAYMLCSVCADLRISEIVDVPNFIVSYYFPRIVFE
ncbi:acetamidase/formamidase family protein [bacterium]|nr:acetamidase/formamidase family protein [bacterium]